MISKDFVANNHSFRGNNLTGYLPFGVPQSDIDKILEKHQDDRYAYLFAYLTKQNIPTLVVFDFEEQKIYDYFYNENIKVTYELNISDFNKYRHLIEFFKEFPLVPLIDIYDDRFFFYITFVNLETNEQIDKVIDADDESIIFNGHWFHYQDHLTLFKHIVSNYGVVYKTANVGIEFNCADSIRVVYKDKNQYYVDPNKDNDNVCHDYQDKHELALRIRLIKPDSDKYNRYLEKFYHVIKLIMVRNMTEIEDEIKQYLEQKVSFLNWF